MSCQPSGSIEMAGRCRMCRPPEARSLDSSAVKLDAPRNAAPAAGAQQHGRDKPPQPALKQLQRMDTSAAHMRGHLLQALPPPLPQNQPCQHNMQLATGQTDHPCSQHAHLGSRQSTARPTRRPGLGPHLAPARIRTRSRTHPRGWTQQWGPSSRRATRRT